MNHTCMLMFVLCFCFQAIEFHETNVILTGRVSFALPSRALTIWPHFVFLFFIKRNVHVCFLSAYALIFFLQVIALVLSYFLYYLSNFSLSFIFKCLLLSLFNKISLFVFPHSPGLLFLTLYLNISLTFRCFILKYESKFSTRAYFNFF